MKILAAFSCYNESLFLDYAIKSIYDFVDLIALTDCAMQSALDVGFPPRSLDGTQNIVDKWVDNKKVFFLQHKKTPKTFGELMTPCLDFAKQKNMDYYIHIDSNEIWPTSAIKMVKPYLKICESKGILALNVWMNIFGPDFWHYKDFRNPRIAKITKESFICDSGDAMIWPELNLYQYAGDCEHICPVGTPERIQKVNGDFPKQLRPFHYSCVGESRIQFKIDFYKKFNNSWGDRYNKAFFEKNWKAFENFGYKPFTGKHPEIMETHPLYNQRLY